MRQVTKDEFFTPIFRDKLDVHPRIVNSRYPYTEEWEFPRKVGRPVYGKTIGQHDGSSLYYLFD